MKSHCRKYFAAILAVIALGCTCLTAEYPASVTDAISEIRWSSAIVRHQLGRFYTADMTYLPTLLTLQQSPILLCVAAAAAREDIAVPATETAITTVPSTPVSTEPNDLIYRENGVPSQTVLPRNTAGYTLVNGVYIKNASSKTLDADLLASLSLSGSSDSSPQVLIIHTHGSEAYSLPEGQSYHSTGNYRTDDSNYSVIRVGDEIAATLSACGISVLHDRERYDDPLYEGAYERSAAAIEAYLEKYPDIAYILDIHRDAVQDSDGNQYKLIAQEDPTLAQISFIMGSNHDGWEENLKLAVAVSAQITSSYPTAMRPITLRNSNYNQQYTPGSILVEVGTAGNSPEEAIHAGRVFAKAFAETVLANQIDCKQ